MGVAFISVGYHFLLLLEKAREKINQWVKDHWSFNESHYSRWHFLFFSCGVILLFLAMADLRGDAKSIRTEIPLQRTAILIDVSLSMFAEDVRPNRMNKAIQVAKHFVRKAVGHSISLMIFSDTHKQLVPFTEDIDLLDARLNALRNLDLKRGGSSIRKALQETLGYLAGGPKGKSRASGNIMIISDADETLPGFKLDIPDSITVAYVAIGTMKGGKIPLRSRRGVLQGYKKYQNQEVISKVNELELKKWQNKIHNFNYWILSSYSIPTESIMHYLKKTHQDRFVQRESIIRPVLMEYIVVPALIFLILSFILRLAPRYVMNIILIISLIPGGEIRADSLKEDEPSLTGDPLYKKFKQGTANKKERLKLAEKYLKKDQVEKALNIYKENISQSEMEDTDYQAAIINYGTALMKGGRFREGLDLLSDYKDSVGSEKIKKMIHENILALLKEQQQQREQEQKKKPQQEQKRKQNQSQKQKGAQRKNNKEHQEEKKEQDGQEQEKDQSQKQNQGPKKNHKDQKQEGNIKKRKKVELPVLLKQLVDKDKKLQEKMLDTKTKQRRSSQQKDW